MRVIRPSALTASIFGVMGLLICFPGFITVARGQLDGIVSLLMGAVVAIVPVARYRVSWDADMLTYRGLVVARTVRFSEMKKFDVSGPDPGDRFGPTLGLRIFDRSSPKPVMTINIKPFSRSDIAALVARLNEALGRQVYEHPR